MPDYLQLWYRNLLTRTSGTIKREGEAWGECNRRMEPPRRAKIKIRLGPSNDLQILDKLDRDTSARLKQNGYYDYIVYGVLDVMLTDVGGPYRSFKLRLLDAEIDDIESTQMAFRLAARDAATKILAQIS